MHRDFDEYLEIGGEVLSDIVFEVGVRVYLVLAVALYLVTAPLVATVGLLAVIFSRRSSK